MNIFSVFINAELPSAQSQNVLLQSEPLETFMNLQIMPDEKYNEFNQILSSKKKTIKETIIRFLRRNTNAKDTFEAFTRACEDSLRDSIEAYRKKPPVNGNYIF